MKTLSFIFISILFFTSCSTKIAHTQAKLPHNENYVKLLQIFKESCKTTQVQLLYPKSCNDIKTYTLNAKSAKSFFDTHFTIEENRNPKGLMTGYYEPLVYGSLVKTREYKYPLYEKPHDLLKIEIAELYPQLAHKRVRGRILGTKVVPYYTREEINTMKIDAKIICYLKSRIDRFFLEVQGSGRVQLRDGSIIFVGYADQNGHKYTSIGKYLVKTKKIKKEKISLQTIKEYFKNNPDAIDEVLHQNKSFVFFKLNSEAAKGALGLVLTSNRSVAVDPAYTKLGELLLLNVYGDDSYSKIVFAQDSGGAIIGPNRADMFYGYGDKAFEKAGSELATIKLYKIKEK